MAHIVWGSGNENRFFFIIQLPPILAKKQGRRACIVTDCTTHPLNDGMRAAAADPSEDLDILPFGQTLRTDGKGYSNVDHSKRREGEPNQLQEPPLEFPKHRSCLVGSEMRAPGVRFWAQQLCGVWGKALQRRTGGYHSCATRSTVQVRTMKNRWYCQVRWPHVPEAQSRGRCR